LVIKASVKESKLEELESNIGDGVEDSEATVDLFVVIDISYSMKGEKINQVKESLMLLLDLLKPNDRISFITFHSVSKYIMAPKKVGQSRSLIESVIQSLSVAESTNIRAGIYTAFKAILDRKSKNQVTGIILLSDGMDNQYFHKGGERVNNFFAEWSEKLASHPYNMHTFGYGHDHDANLMEQIARLNGGSFHYINDVSKVDESFADYLGGLCSVIGRNAYLNIKLNPSDTFPEIRF